MAQPSQDNSLPQSETPWGFAFQMNERFLDWDASASKRLVRMTLAKKLNLTDDEVEARLAELGRLVPDMVNRMECTRADILLSMLQNTAGTVSMLMAMRELLPGVNVSLLVSRCPQILMDYTPQTLADRLESMRRVLPDVRVEALVDAEPHMLKADLDQVLASIRRIMPGVDAVGVLLAQPHMVLDMGQAGMDSALDVEGFTPTAKRSVP